MRASIADFYKLCSHHLSVTNATEYNYDAVEKEMARMAKRLYKSKKFDKIDMPVTTAVADLLWQGVRTGYNGDLYSVAFDSPDYTKLKELRRNVWQFAGAKNLSQLQLYNAELFAEDGTLRSRAEFIDATRQINSTFANKWLGTEYDMAIAASTMASKWVQVEQNKEALPYLMLDAVIDTQTSDICRPIDGIILPINHPFWDKFTPPNHWKCRSTIAQLANATPTDQALVSEKVSKANIKEQFQVNLGKKGWIYPEKHPYFAELTEQALRNINIAYKQWVYAQPLEQQYTTLYTTPNGGQVNIHHLVDPKYNKKDDDYTDLIDIAKLFANQGDVVEILPEIDPKDWHMYNNKIRPNYTKFGKNPDFRINGEFYELKRPKKNIVAWIHSCFEEQGAIAIISDINTDLNNYKIENFIGNIIRDIYKPEIIIFIQNNNIITKVL